MLQIRVFVCGFETNHSSKYSRGLYFKYNYENGLNSVTVTILTVCTLAHFLVEEKLIFKKCVWGEGKFFSMLICIGL